MQTGDFSQVPVGNRCHRFPPGSASSRSVSTTAEHPMTGTVSKALIHHVRADSISDDRLRAIWKTVPDRRS